MNRAMYLQLVVVLFLTGIAGKAAEPPILRLANAEIVSAPSQYRLDFEVANPNSKQKLPYWGYLTNSFDPPLKAGEIAP